MKLRREIARTRIELMREIIENYTDGHSCSENRVEGMSCIICALESLNKPLALLQYLRAKGSARKLFISEGKLIDLLGEEEVKKRSQIEVDIIHNVPKKTCSGCSKVVGVWMPYSLAAVYVHSGNKVRLQTSCSHCGDTIYFDKTELTMTLKKRRNLSTQRLIARSLAGRMGYEEPEEARNSLSMNEIAKYWTVTHNVDGTLAINNLEEEEE